MNIVMLSANLPHPSWGASTRNFYVLRALARCHEVTLLACVDATEVAAYRREPLLDELVARLELVVRPLVLHKRALQLRNLLLGRSHLLYTFDLPEMQAALDALLVDEKYDLVLCESIFMAGYRVPERVKLVVDQHNIEHELLYRTFENEQGRLRKWYSWQESRLLKPIEMERCARADAVLVTSEREQGELRRMLQRDEVFVVPNGVDIERFTPSASTRVIADRVVFTGAMNYYPNVDAVLHFAHECWPLILAHIPAATWYIVGRDPLPEVCRLAALPGVTVTGSVPDVRPYLCEAAVAIAPLRIGGGTRLKILEALAMSKPVVTTSLGCEGLAVESGRQLIIADEPDAFAQALLMLMNSPQKCALFGEAGRQLVELEYSWVRCGERLLHVLDRSGS